MNMGKLVPECKAVFECQQCGHCCEGTGGIVLSEHDLERLACYLGRTPEQTRLECTEISNGKLKVRTGPDGFCIFFKKGIGCAVHEGKPDVCRAWPFFRGNLVDPVSLDMARDFCPGISRSASFGQFVKDGLEYLRSNSLVAGNMDTDPVALSVNSENIHGAAGALSRERD